MIKVVIESPLAGDFEKNVRYALWCAYHCYLRGESAFASHLFFPQFLDDRKPDAREYGIEAGYDWASDGDIFAFYLDLSWSVGMERAKQRWEGRKIEHRMLPKELLAKFEAGEYPPGTLFHMAQEIVQLKDQLDLAAAQNYCTLCGETLDGYVPPEMKPERD